MVTTIHGYFEHLAEADLRFLARTALGHAEEADGARRLRTEPDLLERVLGDEIVYERLLAAPRVPDPLLAASPFLVFAVSVHRGARDLARASSVSEWVGPGRRLIVLDVERLRDFLSDPCHKLFLAELLASYTHVASGTVSVRSHRGWRRHRYSELDPVRFASLIEMVPETERPGIYRRLGDLALFLTGVFPDHSSMHAIGPLQTQRLLRTLPQAGGRRGLGEPDVGALGLLEALGELWYRAACATATPPLSGSLRMVASIAEHFGEARRVLNFIAERYLFPRRARWFGAL